MRRNNRLTMAADTMHLVAACVGAMVPSTVAAGKAEERHGGHTCGSKSNAKDVEIHLNLFRGGEASAEYCGESSPDNYVMQDIPGRIDSLTGILRELYLLCNPPSG
jgi:hypothetical protein